MAIDQIAQSGLSSLSVIYYSAQLFRLSVAIQIKGFLKHQKINRPSASKIPLPPEFTESKAGKEEKRAP
ncbi:MAG: hypothetical protein E7I78_10925, partial [Staphylococcus lugdunensis]|nr:hypothetical protein [Staphylococcus lugdunensis]